ncbi:hypothetical protein JCM19232_3391 [Vibrio ishigakensis]|uniref:Uncharacterized protein n=1 Tax=Vibrio ishigakensis TaxID=1481914 RepID=A0A0B8PBE7_9VIBR|nr:hypothetical protein JCM19232_3391 [Vibrio ishigakensis]
MDIPFAGIHGGLARLLFLLLFTTSIAMGFRYFESATLFEQGLAFKL